MRMSLKISVAGLFVAGVLSGPIAESPVSSHHHSISMFGGEHGPVADCAGLRIHLNERAAEMRSEERTITRPEGPFRVESEVNGGLQVQGWDKDTYSVTVCKAADASMSNVEQIFSQIKLSVENGRVSVSGPSGRDNWTVFLLIRAPKSANLELKAQNGPLSIYDLDGRLVARAINGPISLQGFSGDADISAENGPIDLTGNSGKMRLHTENGPISVSLSGDAWKGSGLQADAQNGPLTLRVPKNYQSSLLVESDGHSPMSCQASFCSDAHKTWDEDSRRIEFGNAPAVIHLSTVNGPISVKQL
jgi:DUF4097 and DUF4098 domain-containing protein YvlB